MPQPPGVIDRVNYVIETWNNPCDAPWYVYLETAKPAALEALVMLACFDVDDVVRYIFRPANLRGGGHIRSRRRGRKGRKRARLGERIRNKVAPLRAIKHRKVTTGVKTLWVIDGIGQRLLWWWLVIDVATGFAYNWTSLLYKTEHCQMALGPGALGAETGPKTHGGIATFQAIRWDRISYMRGEVGGGPFSFSVGEGDWSVEVGISFFNFTMGFTTCGLRLTLDSADGRHVISGGPITIAAGQTGSLNLGGKIRGPGGLGLEYHSFSGWVDLTGILYVQGIPPEGPPPPLNFKCNSILWPNW